MPTLRSLVVAGTTSFGSRVQKHSLPSDDPKVKAGAQGSHCLSLRGMSCFDVSDGIENERTSWPRSFVCDLCGGNRSLRGMSCFDVSDGIEKERTSWPRSFVCDLCGGNRNSLGDAVRMCMRLAKGVDAEGWLILGARSRLCDLRVTDDVGATDCWSDVGARLRWGCLPMLQGAFMREAGDFLTEVLVAAGLHMQCLHTMLWST